MRRFGNVNFKFLICTITFVTLSHFRLSYVPPGRRPRMHIILQYLYPIDKYMDHTQ